jgi:hypothetical protein
MPIWVTKDKRRVAVVHMTDQHIDNATAMLRRREAALKETPDPPSFQGEMAQYYAERDWANSLEDIARDLDATRWWIRALEQEKHRRAKCRFFTQRLKEPLPPEADDPDSYLDDEPSGGPYHRPDQ